MKKGCSYEMDINAENLCKVGNWNNNAGLNTIAHYLSYLIHEGEFFARYLAQEDEEHQPLNELIEIFAQIYELKNVTIEKFCTFFNEKIVYPCDVEYSLALPLRALLLKVLKVNKRQLMAPMLLPDWNDAVAKYINGASMASFNMHQQVIVKGCSNILDEYRAKFNIAKEHNPKIGDFEFITNRNCSDVEKFWLTKGYDSYIENICQSCNYLGIEQIQLLASYLGIDVYPYLKHETSPDSGRFFFTPLQQVFQGHKSWSLVIVERDQDWAFLLPSIDKVQEHNKMLQRHASLIMLETNNLIAESDIKINFSNLWNEFK